MTNDIEQAAKYQRIKIGLKVSGIILQIVWLLFLLFKGANILSGWAAQIGSTIGMMEGYYGQLTLFMLLFLLTSTLIGLPLSFIGGFCVEHAFKLSNQSFIAWAWDQIKEFLLSTLIMLPIIISIYALIRFSSGYWWLWTAIMICSITLFFAKFAPVFLLPLFYKLEPIENEELTSRLTELCAQVKIKLTGLFELKLSEKTKAANAAFTGLGKTKRVLLGDTLLDNFELDEIETVLGHELGHYYYKHILWMILMQMALIFCGFFMVHQVLSLITFYQGQMDVLRKIADLLSYQTLFDYRNLPMFMVVFSSISFLLFPLNNMLSRYFERQADRFAIQLTSKKAAFISALRKLAKQNLANENPHPVIEFLFYSHPSIGRRIRYIETMKEERKE